MSEGENYKSNSKVLLGNQKNTSSFNVINGDEKVPLKMKIHKGKSPIPSKSSANPILGDGDASDNESNFNNFNPKNYGAVGFGSRKSENIINKS